MKFCGQCAAPLALVCPSCGASNPPGNNFCGQCAKPLGGPIQPHFPSPDSYTPKHLVEKILTSHSALVGERKHVTVLFADMKGSMELLANRDPEDARRLLDSVLERMMEAVHRYEGTVNQVSGDGIMAIFGAPLAHEDHAVRACYAALRMQDAVKRYAEKLRRTDGISLQIRVGLNSGEVVVASLRNDLRMDYTAVGERTHLAARMEQMAKPGSVLLTAETLRQAAAFVRVNPLGPMPIKGLSEPVEAFELIGVDAPRTRFQASAARGLTHFVERRSELDQLQRALDRAQAGHGEIVAPVGEPGVGKSRLLWEFTRSHRTQGWLILETGCVSHGNGNPYLPVIDLLRTYFRLEDQDDARTIREKVTTRLLALDRALEPTLPPLLALLDLPVEDSQWQALDSSQRRRRIQEAVKHLLLRESQAQPLLLILEDLHWIDAETQTFLNSLVESLPTARMLLLVTYRPEYQHPWGNKTYYTQLRIDPLPPRGAEELLQALLGEDPSMSPLKRLLISRTEGNPFFLEESVRALIETKVLVEKRGTYRMASGLPGVQVPATVQAVLAARIDRLPPEEKHLLQSTAVIGKDIPFVLLEAIADQPEEHLRRGLAHLQAAEFLYETTLFPHLQYSFKHALTHEVAYGSLLQETRRALHLRIMAAIEQVFPDRLVEHVERLASHAFRGEAWGKAVGYLRQASAKAAARSAHGEAVGYFEQALVALQHLPETRETLEQAIDLRLGLRTSLYAQGEIRKGLAYLHEAEQLARKIDDPRRLGLVLSYIGVNTWSTGHALEARAFAQSALAIAEKLGDLPLMVMTNFYLGSGSLVLGDYRGAAASLEKTVELLQGGLSRERFVMAGFPAVMARGWLAWVLADRGEFEEGLRYGREALQMAEAFGQPFSIARTLNDIGYLYCVRGDFDSAVPLLERGLALCLEWNFLILSPITTGLLGYGYALSGRVAEGLSLQEQAEAKGESLELLWPRALQDVHRGETHLLTSAVDDAHEYAERAVTFARERRQRGYEAWATRLQGDIASRRDQPDIEGATASYRDGIALARELGMQPLLAHCRLGLGTLSAKVGRREEACSELSAAIGLYRAMNMAFWLAKAQGALAKLTN
jgi:class 3 adenylate cyclase/tetratricopeptide (TPR) repeat protein